MAVVLALPMWSDGTEFEEWCRNVIRCLRGVLCAVLCSGTEGNILSEHIVLVNRLLQPTETGLCSDNSPASQSYKLM